MSADARPQPDRTASATATSDSAHVLRIGGRASDAKGLSGVEATADLLFDLLKPAS